MPLQLRRASGEDLVAAQQCYKLSNVHPPTSYEVRGSPLTAPTLAFPPPVLAYCCSRGLLFTIVVHQGYCCSVVTVNNNNTVQKLTFGNSRGLTSNPNKCTFFGKVSNLRPVLSRDTRTRMDLIENSSDLEMGRPTGTRLSQGGAYPALDEITSQPFSRENTSKPVDVRVH